MTVEVVRDSKPPIREVVFRLSESEVRQLGVALRGVDHCVGWGRIVLRDLLQTIHQAGL